MPLLPAKEAGDAEAAPAPEPEPEPEAEVSTFLRGLAGLACLTRECVQAEEEGEEDGPEEVEETENPVSKD